MASDWIKMRVALAYDLKVTRIVRSLSNDPDSGVSGCNANVLHLCAVGALHKFWCACQEHTTDGKLVGLIDSDIDSLVGIPGFAKALIRVGWVEDLGGGVLQVHNWQAHNGEGAKKRAETQKRVKKHRALKRDCVTKALPEKEKSKSIGEEYVSVSSEEAQPTKKESQPHKHEPALAGDVRAVFEHYKTYHPRAFPKPSPASKEAKLIKARLNDGYSVDDLKGAIDGNHRSPFHNGENPGGTTYHSLELIMRDSSQVQKFMEEPTTRTVLSEKNRRSVNAAQSLLKKEFGDDYDQLFRTNGLAAG